MSSIFIATSAWKRLSLQGRIGLAVILAILGACLGSLPYTLAAPTVTLESRALVPRYDAGSARNARRPPEWSSAPESHLWGTDALGRSVLLRCLTGGATSLTIGLLAAAVSVTLGTLWGGIAAYSGGRTDALMMRIVDVLYGLPYVLLVVLLAVAADSLVDEYVSRQRERDAWNRSHLSTALTESGKTPQDADVRRLLAASAKESSELVRRIRTEGLAAVPPRTMNLNTRTLLNLGTLLIAIGGVSWLTTARVTRGQVLSLKQRAFVEAARASGASTSRIFIRHLLPNLTGTIIVYATLAVPQAILQESFLSFLGVGIQPPLPSWGTLASDALGELNPYQSNWWLLFFPCALLSITLLGLNFLGEGLRDALDPSRSSRADASDAQEGAS